MTAPAASPGIEPRAGETRPAPLVLLVGNPNVGKTTLFNRLTGENARVANYPGVTVERRSATLALGARNAELVDMPGCYSLSARSPEEQIAIFALLGFAQNPRPDLAIVVADAGQLLRSLYLVLQLVELGVPTLVALNMVDEVPDPPSARAVAELFGVPCVAVSARTGTGLLELRQTMERALAEPPRGRIDVPYPALLIADADRVAEKLPAAWRSEPRDARRERALGLWALASIEADDELLDVDPALREACVDAHAQASDRDLDHELIATRWGLLDASAPKLHKRIDPHPPKRRLSERVDRILLHPVAGFVAFMATMLVVFQSLFSWADPAISLIEAVVSWLQSSIGRVLPAGIVRDLLAQGVVGGVGNVLVFLPQILLLFLFLGLLEDSGYMARVAYLMDRIMRALGLNGRAFVPMLSGFACAVPAILGTRTMERQRDRVLTMLVIPLMTCSARLPVYTLIIAALFPPSKVFGLVPVQGLLMVAMYVFAVVTTLVVAAVLGKVAVRGRRVPLILELPPYRLPSPRTTLRGMLLRARVFLGEAGTVILACTVVLWALLYFPRSETTAAGLPVREAAAEVRSASDTNAAQARQLEHSFGGRIGKAIEPAIAPLGFDWKIGVGILGAFAAREVFISTMALVYGVGDVDEQALPLRAKIRSETKADGKPVYTPLTGLSLMIFFALACQCMSTLAVVRRETRSWRWPAFMFAYMSALAYAASFAVYQGGTLLGF